MLNNFYVIIFVLLMMSIKDIFKYVKAASFVPEFTRLKYDSMFRHKMRGTDGNKKVIDFTEDEKKEIENGLKLFFKKSLK